MTFSKAFLETGCIVQSIPGDLVSYCKTGDDLELVSRHRLVICTCTSAGMMFTLGLRAGHFTHVFIDEVSLLPNCI